MKSIKIITIALVAATILTALAYRDENGNYHFRPVHDTGYAAKRTVEGTSDVVTGTIGGLFGGRSVSQTIEDRRDEREERRKERQARREANQREEEEEEEPSKEEFDEKLTTGNRNRK